jgi:SEC-C motif-containing protein
MSGETCPCGSGKPEQACCGPYLAGERPAPTAEALMRSRYTAYVRGAIDYIVDTHDPVKREDVDRDAATKWSKQAKWLGLEIVSSAGGEADSEGAVEFIARYQLGGQARMHHERSRFRKEGGAWFYVDGQDGPAPRAPVRKEATAGRNDPCSCGSGKKYKRCHGA